MNIEIIWSNIKRRAGEKFYTVTGLEFTYVLIADDKIRPYREGKTRWVLSKNLFEKALAYKGNFSSKEFSDKIIGSSYVRGILEDPRIM